VLLLSARRSRHSTARKKQGQMKIVVVYFVWFFCETGFIDQKATKNNPTRTFLLEIIDRVWLVVGQSFLCFPRRDQSRLTPGTVPNISSTSQTCQDAGGACH